MLIYLNSDETFWQNYSLFDSARIKKWIEMAVGLYFL